MIRTSKQTHSASVITEVSASGVHAEVVLIWRQDEFRRMGFADYAADLLASTRIDLHEMEDLLKKGCAHDLAMQILMGTMWSGDDPSWQWTDEKLEALYEQSDREAA